MGGAAMIDALDKEIAPVLSDTLPGAIWSPTLQQRVPLTRRGLLDFIDQRLRGVHQAQRELGEKAAKDHGLPGREAFYDPQRTSWVAVEVAPVSS